MYVAYELPIEFADSPSKIPGTIEEPRDDAEPESVGPDESVPVPGNQLSRLPPTPRDNTSSLQ